jgi:hypothetical protein
MKRITLTLLFLLFSGTCSSQERPYEFLSWYDGWGTHTVWGAGKVMGSYRDASVQCGNTLIPVRAIYDTHNTDGKVLTYAQTRRFARSRNAVVLRKIESHGDKCVFE